MELAEVYRVTYEGPDVKLRGIIVCKDEENGYQYLFKDQHMEDDDIHNTKIYEEAVKQFEGTSKLSIRGRAESELDLREGGEAIGSYEKGEKQFGAPYKRSIRYLDEENGYQYLFEDQDMKDDFLKTFEKLQVNQFVAPSKPLLPLGVSQSEGTSKPLISNRMRIGSKGADKRQDSIGFNVKHFPDDDINNTMLKCNTFQGYKDADKQQNLDSKQLIKSLDHIIPNAPIKSSIRAKDGFSISFYLFGTVYENINFKYPSSRPEKLNVPRIKYIQSEDGFRYLQVFYAIFDNAVEARVKVTLTNNSGLFNLYGVIAARTSAIRYRAYSSLIFCKRRGRGQKIKVYRGRGKVIPLSRDVVAVPLRHQLILEFGLYGCDNDERVEEDNDEMLEEDNDRIVKKTLMFDATKEGTSTAYIHCSKGTFEVVVSWCSTRKPVEAQAQAN